MTGRHQSVVSAGDRRIPVWLAGMAVVFRSWKDMARTVNLCTDGVANEPREVPDKGYFGVPGEQRP